MDSPDSHPFDPASAAELVVRVVDAIDASNDRDRDELLLDLLSAAWGSSVAQQQ
jgi:hypothetical protein